MKLQTTPHVTYSDNNFPTMCQNHINSFKKDFKHLLVLSATSQQQGRLNFVSTSSYSPSKTPSKRFSTGNSTCQLHYRKAKDIRAQSFDTIVQKANNKISIRKAVYTRTKSISLIWAASAFGKVTVVYEPFSH